MKAQELHDKYKAAKTDSERLEVLFQCFILLCKGNAQNIDDLNRLKRKISDVEVNTMPIGSGS